MVSCEGYGNPVSKIGHIDVRLTPESDSVYITWKTELHYIAVSTSNVLEIIRYSMSRDTTNFEISRKSSPFDI